MDMQNYLPKGQRILWLFALSLLGIIPLVMSIFWVNGNMTLPGEVHRLFQDKLGWPWLPFEESPLSVHTLIDVILTLAAFSLTFAASRRKLSQTQRAVTVVTLGAALFCVMSCWQYTGIILWSVRTPLYFSDALYFVLVALSIYLGATAVNIWEVLGFSPIYAEKNSIFPSVSLSIRSFLPLCVALFATPNMSLDRLLFSIVTIIFLTFLLRFSRLAIASSA